MTETRNADMSRYSGYGCGGAADILIEIERRDELPGVIARLVSEGTPRHIIGMGFNTLIGPGGIRGAVIRLTGEFERVVSEGAEVRSGAGAPLPAVVLYAARRGLSGIEFLAGIPGTIGGAVCGNSGTSEKWVQHAVKDIEVFRDGDFIRLTREQAGFSYRSSKLRPGDIITECVFLLEKSSGDTVRAVADLIKEKKIKHPDKGSCGCVFKNPGNGKVSAGKIIQELGLAGISEGRARVSDKHANFIICEPGAGCNDVWRLIKRVRKEVMERAGQKLELELKLIGEGFD